MEAMFLRAFIMNDVWHLFVRQSHYLDDWVPINVLFSKPLCYFRQSKGSDAVVLFWTWLGEPFSIPKINIHIYKKFDWPIRWLKRAITVPCTVTDISRVRKTYSLKGLDKSKINCDCFPFSMRNNLKTAQSITYSTSKPSLCQQKCSWHTTNQHWLRIYSKTEREKITNIWLSAKQQTCKYWCIRKTQPSLRDNIP